ncbi:uncharacterized protein LOC142646017 [Dermatophagoides pteronyssinus]|uniref:uncharacterized protein LOC142646017 n=1 Tax=Dermatophagoides pteronyssinus TaxID=6956 RepID=UPI003F678D42
MKLNSILTTTTTTKSTTTTTKSTTTTKLDNQQQQRQQQQRNFPKINHWLPTSSSSSSTLLHLSLDPPIQTLADATFKLLRKQYWFDALLIIDESIISDQFARRLSSLCNSFRFDYEQRQQRQLYRHQRQTTKTISSTKTSKTFILPQLSSSSSSTKAQFK